MKGYVYLIQSSGYTKIGMSTSPRQRYTHLQTANPNEVTLRYLFSCDDVFFVERSSHRHFRQYRIRGEWFKLDADTIAEWIVNESGLGVSLYFKGESDEEVIDAARINIRINPHVVELVLALFFWLSLAIPMINAIVNPIEEITPLHGIVYFCTLFAFTLWAISAGARAFEWETRHC